MMLKFLTHKLRTQTLNDQQPYLYKNDEERDSGTESDGEAAEPEDIMESEAEHSLPASPASSSPELVLNGGACHPPVPPVAVSPYFLDSALPSDSDHNYDHHSSEEELEVINSHVTHHHRHHHHRKHSSSACGAAGVPALCDTAATPTAGACTSVHISACPTASTPRDPAYPEKRKWSQVVTTSTPVSCEALLSPVSVANNNNNVNGGVVTSTRVESSGSSDEEVQGLMAAMATPVEFRTSPPIDAHKPGHKPGRSLSPPLKLFHYSPTPLTAASSGVSSSALLEVSPRKRHYRGTPRAHHIQRPCLDFEKMQQLKARAVTAWRHSGEHGGGELSVFCW